MRGSRSWGGSSTLMSGSSSNLPSTPATANVDFNRIFAASCAAFFISEGDRPTFASAFNDFLSQMSIKRLTFPRKLLNGEPLQKPEGVLNENLEYFFQTSLIASTVRKKSADEGSESNHPGSGYSETRKSPSLLTPPHLRASSPDKATTNHSQ